MMKARKLSALLCVAMLASSLAACGGNGSGSSTSSETSTETTSGGTESAESVVTDPSELPDVTLPLTEEPVTITYFQTTDGNATQVVDDYNDLDVYQELEKRTGVHIEWQMSTSADTQTNFNLMISSNQLADVMYGASYYTDGIEAGIDDGYFLDLTDLIPEYAPHYNAVRNSNETYRKLSMTDSGRIGALYQLQQSIQGPWDGLQVRKDWLDEWGMEIPTTFAEYEEYFKKVQETYPDVSPFTLDKTGLEQQFLATFEAATVDNGIRFFVKDGVIHHTFNEPGLKDYLTLMNDWYQKGYINKDFTTIDNVDQEFATGRTAMVVGNSDAIYTLAQDLDFEPTTGPYPRVNEGDLYHGDIFYFPQNGTPCAISAKSQNKELALQFLNYGFTKQGSGVINFGDPDTSWTWSTEANPDYGMTIPEYTDYALNNPDYPASDLEYTVRLHTCWSKYRYGDDVSMIRNVADPGCWDYRAMWGDDETSDNSYALPGLNFSTEVANEIGTLTTDINTYAEEMCLKFITGATPLSEFDSFTQQVEALGMSRLLELYQQAYDALLSKQR